MENKKFQSLANNIQAAVGGRENVKTLIHCATRLRYTFNDHTKIDEESLKAIDGVLGIQWMTDQLHIVIGPDVAEVFNLLYQGKEEVKIAEAEGKSGFMKKISSCVIPLIAGMIGCGLLKGLLSVLTGFGWLSADNSTYIVLYAIADSIFYFLPVLAGFTSAKAFGCNPVIGGIIGASLIHPNILGQDLALFGIQLAPINYASSLFPAMAAVYVASLVEKKVKKMVPASVGQLLIPFLQVAVVCPLAYLVIGPVMTVISNGLFAAINTICETVPLIGGMLLGGFFQVSVIFGLHYALIPIFVADLMAHGYTTLGAPVGVGFFALAGMCLGYSIANKNRTEKGFAVSAGIMALLGLTEPALFTVAVPHPKHFISQAIGGCLGGLIYMSLPVTQYFIGASGVFGFAGFISPNGFDRNFVMSIVGAAVAFIVPLFISMYLQRKES